MWTVWTENAVRALRVAFKGGKSFQLQLSREEG
jgi:hypothetical protein